MITEAAEAAATATSNKRITTTATNSYACRSMQIGRGGETPSRVAKLSLFVSVKAAGVLHPHPDQRYLVKNDFRFFWQ